MAQVTGIQWTDNTWSPWIGCQKAGPGCDNCYAEALNVRFARGANWGPGAPRRKTVDWSKPYAWDRAAAKRGVRQRLFPSMCDPFDNAVDPFWRAEYFALIHGTPNLDHLLLTKRIGNAEEMIAAAVAEVRRALPDVPAWPWPNVWLGATLVNREELLRDGPKLKATRAAVHFWSVEPMLGDFGAIPRELMPDWVIAGGESGQRARPPHPQWFRSLRDQCDAAGVAYFFKQWGEWAQAEAIPESDTRVLPERWLRPDGTEAPSDAIDFFGGDEAVYRVGKRSADNTLDGARHADFPLAAEVST